MNGIKRCVLTLTLSIVFAISMACLALQSDFIVLSCRSGSLHTAGPQKSNNTYMDFNPSLQPVMHGYRVPTS